MRLTALTIVVVLASGMGLQARAQAPEPPAAAPDTAPAGPPAPATSPALAPAAAYDPWTRAPVPYAPPVGSVPPPTYPLPPQAYPMPYLPPSQPPPGFHTHDGFFLRFMMGMGYLRVASASAGTDLQAAGATFGDMVSFGWAVRENLVLSLDTSVFMGKPSMGGASRLPGATDAFFGFMQMGPGVTYYFMPHNLFASAGFGMGNIFLTERQEGEPDFDHDMNMGWGATLSGGKEWWTSDNWGLGGAGRLVYVQSKEQATGSLFRAFSVSVAFTATYN